LRAPFIDETRVLVDPELVFFNVKEDADVVEEAVVDDIELEL